MPESIKTKHKKLGKIPKINSDGSQYAVLFPPNAILLENGFYLILENGFYLIQE